MTKQNLLLDDDWEEDQPTLKVNEEYARRFEYNKRREELHRLQEKHPEVAAKLTAKAAAEAARAARQAAGAAGRAQRGDADEEDEPESSSSEDDDEEELDADDDTEKVLETLVRIKRQDPVLKQPDAVLFPQQDDNDDDDGEEDAAAADGDADNGAAAAAAAAGGGKAKKSKPMYLRTVLAQQALEGAAASDSDADGAEGDSEDGRLPRQPVSHSYAAEQQELKAAFLKAAAEAEQEQEEGLLHKKKKQKREEEQEGAAAVAAGGGTADKQQHVNKLLDEYFGTDAELDPAGAFLKSYIANKAWKEPRDRALGGSSSKKKRIRGLDGGSSSSEDEGSDDVDDSSGDEQGGRVAAAGGDLAVDDEEDEEFLEEVDRFEAAYNFRFEEPGSHRIQSFPRVIADSVRRPDERRKQARQAKADRKLAEKEAREAEVRRLKNLKKQEIQDMFARVQEEAGIKKRHTGDGAEEEEEQDAAVAPPASSGLANLLDELLEGDFDPEAYDKRMAAAFDDAYYEGDDEPDELFGDGEEELAPEADVLTPAAQAVLGSEEEDEAGGFAALHKQLHQQEQEGDKEAAAAALAEQRSALQRKLEEYYKLDCEDNIAGIPCRFKYRQVPAESFGLSVEDILALPDKDLNQIIGMKKITAPYQDEGRRLRPNYKALQRIKGEAAAAAAMRQQKRDVQRQKTQHKLQQRQHHRQHQDEQQQQQDGHAADAGAVQGQQGRKVQQQAGYKRRFEHTNGKQHGQPAHKKYTQQQPKPLAEMTAEEKQAARLASYAKLTLKPNKQPQEEGDAGVQHKKHKSGGSKRKGEEQHKEKLLQPQPQGRLSNVQLDAPLTKAQKKNLLRALKRKEKKGQT